MYLRRQFFSVVVFSVCLLLVVFAIFLCTMLAQHCHAAMPCCQTHGTRSQPPHKSSAVSDHMGEFRQRVSVSRRPRKNVRYKKNGKQPRFGWWAMVSGWFDWLAPKHVWCFLPLCTNCWCFTMWPSSLSLSPFGSGYVFSLVHKTKSSRENMSRRVGRSEQQENKAS